MGNNAYILLGANLGFTRETFSIARTMISKEAGEIVSASSLYQTQPWGFESDDTFLNQAILINTRLDAKALLEILLKIEEVLGRKRNGAGYESRTIDIDILFFNNEIIETDALNVPHPRMHLRNFALAPMVELATDFMHPVLNKTMAELKQYCPDNHEVALCEDQQVGLESL